MVDSLATPTAAGARNRWSMFGVLAATAALTILDVSKVGVALPAIQESTGGSPSTVQLMLVGYTLAYATTLLPAGRIGDVLPRRTVFLVGASVFVAASLLCSLAPTVEWLVAGRVLQGIGAGLLMPQVLGLIQRTFPPEERAKPLAMLAAIISITSLVGPVLAGVIMDLAGDELGWRLLFVVSVVAGAIVLPIALRVLREPPTERRRGFDARGSVLLVLGVALTIAPFSAISKDQPFEPWMIAATVVGVGFTAWFVAYERRLVRAGAEGLVDPTLFRLPHLPAGVLISGCLHAAGTAGTLIVTISLQQIAGLDALHTALWMLPAAAASILGSIIASRLSSTDGRIVTIGIIVGALGVIGNAFVFGVVPQEWVPPLVALVLLAYSFGTAVAAPSNQARTLMSVPEYRSSVGGSLIQFSQRVGSAIGMALALMVYYAVQYNTTFAGQAALGPMLALLCVAGFLVIAAVIAIVDHMRQEGAG